jgi:hypothetical protein
MDFHWYLPSMYGDIRLERVSAEATRLVVTGLSPTEKDAIGALAKKAAKPGPLQKPWSSEALLSLLDLDSTKEQVVTLSAPISKVQDVLQKSLKPHRKQVSAVLFTNGRVEQVTEATLQVIDAGSERSESPSSNQTPEASSAKSTSTTPSGGPETSTSGGSGSGTTPEKKTEPKKPKAAVTVAQPVLGCPAPEFDDVEIRATRVLRAFLSPEQIADFERRQQFVAVGVDTGHRYLLTSRHSKHGLSLGHARSLYDIDERHALCVHDWEVPASEELLGLFVHLSLPGLERYVRSIPDVDGVLA